MPGLARSVEHHQRSRFSLPVQPRTNPVAGTSGLAAPHPLTLPLLDGIPARFRTTGGDESAVALAKTFLLLDLALPEDWVLSQRDPASFVQRTVARWVTAHAPSEERHYDLCLSVTDSLLSYSSSYGYDTYDLVPGEQMFILMEPSTCGVVVVGPTLERLAQVHPQLPITFHRSLYGSLSSWMRVYDYNDASAYVEMMEDCYYGEPEEDRPEIPNVDGEIPAYMKERPLSEEELSGVLDECSDEFSREIFRLLQDLRAASESAERDVWLEDFQDGYHSEPLPCMTLVFSAHDSVSACFDVEFESAFEVTPSPNLCFHFDARNPEAVLRLHHQIAAFARTLEASVALFDLMPGSRDQRDC